MEKYAIGLEMPTIMEHIRHKMWKMLPHIDNSIVAQNLLSKNRTNITPSSEFKEGETPWIIAKAVEDHPDSPEMIIERLLTSNNPRAVAIAEVMLDVARK